MRLSRIVPVGVVAGALVVSGAPAASAAAGAGGKPSVTVIARKLDNPRGIAVSPTGSLLVAEAGRGGAGPCIPSPENPAEEVCLGASGAISAIVPTGSGPWRTGEGKPRWKKLPIATKLPSVANPDGSFATGPHDVVPAQRGALLATIGLGGPPAARNALGAGARLLGHIVTVTPGDRAPARVAPFADLVAYEVANNPDDGDPGSSVDSNPYGILATSHGAVVTDAGGNDLLRLNQKGAISTLAVFHTRNVPAPPGIPNLPPQIPMQAVPTTVTRGPDGALYVGQLTGFPFPKGGANVWRVVPGQEPTVYASGFTNIIDIAFDRFGRLLVLEIFKNGLLSNDTTGALIRVERGGKRTELAKGKLTTPGGVAVGPDGAIYVTNKSVTAGGGEVLRISA